MYENIIYGEISRSFVGRIVEQIVS